MAMQLATLRWLVTAALIVGLGFSLARPAQGCGGIESEAFLLLMDNAELAAKAEARLKAAGPKGMEVLLEERQRLADQLAQATQPEEAKALSDQLAKLDAAMDRIGNAKYCSRSGLYWHTDLNTAMEAAKKSGKPILSLRMLGNLTDELSCANSRFFRTTLYSNAEISKYLRENFVLHWKSVRPVPVITVDFGDGRKLTRTVTGNSIHYVLTPEGQVVDALPGLYGPQAFLEHIATAGHAARSIYALPAGERATEIATFHQLQLKALNDLWAIDLRRAEQPTPPAAIGPPATLPPTSRVEGNEAVRAAAVVKQQLEKLRNRLAEPQQQPEQEQQLVQQEQQAQVIEQQPAAGQPAPPAQAAGKLAVGKFRVERPLVAAVAPNPPNGAPANPPPAAKAARVARGKELVERPLIAAVAPVRVAPDDVADEQLWARIAALHAAETELDQASLALIRSQNPTAAQAGARALTKRAVEDPLVRMVRAFRDTIALDTVTNEYKLHRKIHEWLANPANHVQVEQLNERVYAQLFLTPSNDPWLGLAPADAYTAIPAGGVAGGQ